MELIALLNLAPLGLFLLEFRLIGAIMFCRTSLVDIGQYLVIIIVLDVFVKVECESLEAQVNLNFLILAGG